MRNALLQFFFLPDYVIVTFCMFYWLHHFSKANNGIHGFKFQLDFFKKPAHKVLLLRQDIFQRDVNANCFLKNETIFKHFWTNTESERRKWQIKRKPKWKHPIFMSEIYFPNTSFVGNLNNSIIDSLHTYSIINSLDLNSPQYLFQADRMTVINIKWNFFNEKLMLLPWIEV